MTAAESPPLVEYERAVVRAAEDFVATTSYFRQPLASRDEFEALAFALVYLREARDKVKP